MQKKNMFFFVPFGQIVIEMLDLLHFEWVRGIEGHQTVEVSISNVASNGAREYDSWLALLYGRALEVSLSLCNDFGKLGKGNTHVRYPQSHLFFEIL